jgi:hypothetical protein
MSKRLKENLASSRITSSTRQQKLRTLRFSDSKEVTMTTSLQNLEEEEEVAAVAEAVEVLQELALLTVEGKEVVNPSSTTRRPSQACLEQLKYKST